jgi:RND family efflux transporter MFP subunit
MRWVIVLLVIAAIAMVVGKGIASRKAAATALASAAEAKRANVSIELATGDTVLAKLVTLSNGIAISGSVKAANTAVVKAKVAGEIRDLAVREGDTVAAGQLLATIDATEFLARQNQAQKTAEAAKAQVDIAQRAFNNNQALVNQNFISKTALDTSLASLEGAKASYAAAVAGVDLAKKSLDDTKLLAPIRGIISMRNVQPGERVGIDARIVEIVDLSRLELEAALAPVDSASVRVGQVATLTIEGTSQAIGARVVRINPATTAGSRAVLVYLALDNAVGLRQGLFAQGTLATTKTEAIAVPVTAVRTDKPAPYVQVVENKKVKHQNVTLGARGILNGTEYVAVQGLADGTNVLQGNVGAVRVGVAVTMAKTN